MQEIQLLQLSVDCVVFGYDDDGLKVLLIQQRSYSDAQGNEMSPQSALPGDLILEDEGLDQAAARVLFELTNLKGIYLKQFHAFGNPNRVREQKDREWLRTFRKDPDQRVITVAYFALVSLHDFTPAPSSFAGSVHWIHIDDIGPLAFDHNHVFQTAVDALREQLESQRISFELLPKKFTLSQLQDVHEIVLRKKFDKRNFRKNIRRMSHVVPLDEKQTGVLHKPAQLFTYQPNTEEQ